MNGHDNHPAPPEPGQKSTVKIGDILKVVSGEFAGYDVVVFSVDHHRGTATVNLAVFGGIDQLPFEIELSALARGGTSPRN